MGISIFFARLLGPFIVIMGAGVLLNRKALARVGEDFSKSPALVYLSGVITFFIGLVIALLHDIWMLDWRLIITIFGWLALIKGIWLILLPDKSAKQSEFYLKRTKLVVVVWVLMIALGTFLTFQGYL